MESGSFQVPNMPIGLVGPLWPPICSAERSWFRDIIQDLEVGDGPGMLLMMEQMECGAHSQGSLGDTEGFVKNVT